MTTIHHKTVICNLCCLFFLFLVHAVSFYLPQCCCSPFSLCLSLSFITFLPLAILSSPKMSFSKSHLAYKTSLVSIFTKRHFMTTILHISHHCLFRFCRTCYLYCLPSCLSFLPHFLVLTNLSIRALRVLCTSSPSLSISAFKRSFCSVSSCTFLSFSCSLSLRLFLVE